MMRCWPNSASSDEGLDLVLLRRDESAGVCHEPVALEALFRDEFLWDGDLDRATSKWTLLASEKEQTAEAASLLIDRSSLRRACMGIGDRSWSFFVKLSAILGYKAEI